MNFTQFDSTAFLRNYWQKKPLLIRNPWASWRNPLSPDDLAGLACEEGVESRLIRRAPDNWEAEHGPFDEPRFGQLGQQPWTLLVQAVDHHVPEVAALIEPFRFIPNWRIDDVMVSYASEGGGVGPHFDQYDVFLIQGLGQRRWQIGDICEDGSELLPHDDLRLLARFEPREEWVLEPGDILYVPPRYAHDGVAVSADCMTYSVGFRAPSRSELIAHYADDLLDQLQDDDRYADPDLPAQANSGEISAAAIGRLHAMVTARMLDPGSFTRWFGRYSSTRKYPDMDWQPEEPLTIEDLRGYLRRGFPLCRNPASRFSFAVQDPPGVLLFVDGECHECGADTADFARQLCAQTLIAVDPALIGCEPAMELIAALYNQGSVAFETGD